MADYLVMLAAELSGVPYNKSEHRQRLRPLLTKRSEGSVEFKHQNISAALIRIGFPYIAGYKPRWNYQRPLLDEVVFEQLTSNTTLLALAQADADRSIAVPTIEDILKILTAPPASRLPREGLRQPKTAYRSAPVNYLEREARNRHLGLSGELLVINFERARLISLNKEPLASRIEHVAKVRGDAEGFDVLSFETTGEDRLIEVKTTKYGQDTPFFVSRHELDVSDARSGQYHLYRVFSFGSVPGLFTLPGALSSTCALDPATYIGTVA